MNKLMNEKKLAVIDFGRTLIEENPDIIVRRLLHSWDYCPFETRKWTWIDYMDEIFEKLHSKSIMKTTILAAVKSIKPNYGFKKLIKALFEDLNFDILVVSGSNKLFVEEWLRCAGLENYILKVISNPAEFDETGRLHIQPYSHRSICPLSSKNLCKDAIIKRFLSKQKSKNVHYANVVFIGDSSEDFCPILNLTEKDIAFPRAGHNCEMILEMNRMRLPAFPNNDTVWPKVKAHVFSWVSGDDILKYLKDFFGFYKY